MQKKRAPMSSHVLTICHSCSNIAIKVNTKLFSKVTKARAWDIELGDIQGGTPWLDQAPTLVMGLSLTRAGGNDSKTVVAGSVSLASKGEGGTIQIAQDIHIQNSDGVVTFENMRKLTKVRGCVQVIISNISELNICSTRHWQFITTCTMMRLCQKEWWFTVMAPQKETLSTCLNWR